ncbi:hypothetical protein FB639_003105, partial [Coemansia asiatica]
MITRQQSSRITATPATAYIGVDQKHQLQQQPELQSRTKRADSIRSTLVLQPMPVMVRQASAPAMRQNYMQIDNAYSANSAVARESDEDTDEDMGIAAMVTKMATPEQQPATIKDHDDASDNETTTSDEMQIENAANQLSSDYQLVEQNDVQIEQKPKEEEKEEEELLQEDVSMVDCSSSIVNAETMSFVSCSETFASSAYETVPSREGSVYEDEQKEREREKTEAALRLSLRLSADATSFANFRLSTIFAREPENNMGTLTEDAEDGQNEEQQQQNQTESDKQQQQQQQDQKQSSSTDTVSSFSNENYEDNENPAHARLRSLRSRQLNKPAESKPASATTETESSSSGRRFRATQTAARPDSGSSKKKPITKMGPLQLDRLTKLNTRRNSTYMTCRIERYTVNKEGSRPPSPSLLMQLRAQERREWLGIDHHSIYSSSDNNSDSNSDNTSDGDDDDAEHDLPNGEIALEDIVFETRPLTPLLLTSEDEGDYDGEGEIESGEGHLEDGRDGIAVQQVSVDPGTSDIKRKSVELSAPLHPSSSCNPGAALSSISGNTRSKKQCRRPKVQWGSRSILKTPYLIGHSPKPARPSKPILTNSVEDEVEEPSPKPVTTGRRLGPHQNSLKI